MDNDDYPSVRIKYAVVQHLSIQQRSRIGAELCRPPGEWADRTTEGAIIGMRTRTTSAPMAA